MTRLLLDFASFGGIASGAAKVGKATAKVSVDAAKKIATTLGGSLTKAAVQETTYKTMKKISAKSIEIDAAVRTTSRKAIDKTADLMGAFMSKLKSSPTSVFDMLKKTSYSEKTKTLTVTTLDNTKLLFNKEELIKNLRTEYPKDVSEDLFKMIHTGCFTGETLVHTT